GELSAIDFLRDVGKHFPVNRMLARDVVAKRLESGISYTECSYVLLQSYDYRELFRRYGCTLQFGGSDQWGNITAGVELVRRSDGERVHALATPLTTKADGTKFSKSEGGAIWLDPELTSPYAFHQAFLNAEDSKVVEYLRVFTDRSDDEIAELERATRDEPYRRLAQRALADDLTALVHSPEDAQAAARAAAALFGRDDITDLPEQVLRGVFQEIAATPLPDSRELPTVMDALAISGVVASESAARRTLAEGGAYRNHTKGTDQDGR